MEITKVLIAEDHPLIVKGLKSILQSLSPTIEINVVDSCEDFMSMITKLESASCIIDLNLSDGMSFSCIENLMSLYPESNVMVYTSFPGALYAKRLFKVGIHGFLNKSANEDELNLALFKFLNNEFYISPEFLSLLFSKGKTFETSLKNPFDLLSFQEMSVMEYLSEGMSIKDISDKMSIMANTAATYKKRAFQKLEIENVIQLKLLFDSYRNKTIDSEEKN